jgi:Tc5 transposase DNA-binding domain
MEATTSAVRQQLSDEQEKALIMQINKLSLRDIPPTSRITQNLAGEIAGVNLGKNWTARFIKRHKKRAFEHLS